MARQFGLVKYIGSVGDATFVRTPDGFFVKEKSSLTAERILTDDKFQRTRENMAEFGSSARAAKLIADSIKTVIQYATDRRMFNRLMSEARKVMDSDTTNPLGHRTVQDGNILLLQGFDFNKNAVMINVFPAELATSIDRVTGEFEVVVPAYVPSNTIKFPEGATHYRLVMAGNELDFSAGTSIITSAESAILPLDTTPTVPLTLTSTATPNSTLPMFLGFGIVFYKQINGVDYPLKNGANNTFELLKIDG